MKSLSEEEKNRLTSAEWEKRVVVNYIVFAILVAVALTAQVVAFLSLAIKLN